MSEKDEGKGDLIQDGSEETDKDVNTTEDEVNHEDSAANVNPDVEYLYDEYGQKAKHIEGVDYLELAGVYEGESNNYKIFSISIFTDGVQDGYTVGTFEIKEGNRDYNGDVVLISDGLYALEVSTRVFYLIAVTGGERENITLDFYNLQNPSVDVESMKMVEHYVS